MQNENSPQLDMHGQNPPQESGMSAHSPSPQISQFDASSESCTQAQTPDMQNMPDGNLQQQIALAEQRGYMRALGINPQSAGSKPVLLSNFNPTSFWD